MTEFDQRLAPEFFDRVQTRVRERMAEAGFDAFLTDHPEDIAYLTGFFHHPSERPVAIWLEAGGRVVMLLPELEREYAESQSSRAELVAFFEYPGVVAPFEVLARAVSPRGRVGFAASMPSARLSAAREAMPDADLVASGLLTRARYVKFPEEVELHREAARVTDRMLDAGVQLVQAAVAAGEIFRPRPSSSDTSPRPAPASCTPSTAMSSSRHCWPGDWSIQGPIPPSRTGSPR